jgi:hypothetical protein
MKKTYKLIREYPGSPSLNTIIEYKRNYYAGIEDWRNIRVAHSHVESNPEYWELQLEQKEIIMYEQKLGEFRKELIDFIRANKYDRRKEFKKDQKNDTVDLQNYPVAIYYEDGNAEDYSIIFNDTDEDDSLLGVGWESTDDYWFDLKFVEIEVLVAIADYIIENKK